MWIRILGSGISCLKNTIFTDEKVIFEPTRPVLHEGTEKGTQRGHLNGNSVLLEQKGRRHLFTYGNFLFVVKLSTVIMIYNDIS
jgi:hypothetical protein